MPKRYKINDEQVDEIERARKGNKDKNIDNRLEVLILHTQRKSRAEIAAKTGYVKEYISEIVAKYCNKGLSAVAENHYGGNHRNMSIAEEEALLEPFREKAKSGQLLGVSEIKQAYEEATGRSLEKNHGQIYRVLERHQWRKVMPRSKHPKKASDEAIEASKKLTPELRN